MARTEDSIFYAITNVKNNLSDTYLLVCIFDEKTKTVEELPGFYPGPEFELITPKFVKEFYLNNSNKYLVGQSAEDDSVFIII